MTGSTIFTNAHVFDGEKFLAAPVDVVIRDGVVAAVGTGLAERDDFGDITDRVDAAGNTLLPGMVDLHVHLTTQGAGDLSKLTEPFAMGYYNSIGYAASTLAAGITSVRDAGGSELAMKVAQQRGLIKGPRMRLAITIMSQTGGHGDGTMHSGACNPLLPVTPGRPNGVADGPDEVRKVARELFRMGADQIKICSTGGVLSPSDDPRHSQFTIDEIKVIVAEAEAHGTYVMSHAQGTQGIKNALIAGVRTIEHGIYLDDETIQLFLDHDAWLVPTLVAPRAVLKAADQPDSGLSPAVIAKARMVLERHQESIKAAYEAGVNIAMGTDSGVGVHGENLEELWLMHDIVGMSLDEVLAATTSKAGQFIGPEG